MTGLFSIYLKFKYADWPFVLQLLFTFTILASLSIYFLEGEILSFTLLFITIFLIVLSVVHHYRLQREELEYSHYKIQAIGEIQKLLPFRAPLSPMIGWAATPELAVSVLKEVIRKKPNTIVELGSGVTTIINGYALEKHNPGGRLISIDHDEIYATKTQKEVDLHGLNKFVEIRTSPMENIEVDGKNHQWYSPSTLQFDNKIDVLIIDGPPVKTEKHARYPALPMLYEHLSEECSIIIHDTKRVPESTIIYHWLDEFPDFEKEVINTDKGVTILRRGEV